MSDEKIKMTDSEILEIKLLQEKFQQKVFQLGQLYLQKMQVEASIKTLNEQEIKLRDEWLSLQKMENELIDKMLTKYGEGSLDLKAGTFVIDKKVTATS
jgi:hypothetical protein